MPVPEGYKFPDLSKFRRVGDWDVYTHAYPISACKATQGASHKDEYFPAWRANMRQRGLLPIVYHFLTNSAVPPQVDNYLATANDGAEFGIMLDVETDGNGVNPTVAQANAWFELVHDRTGVPIDHMFLYMPRWWYASFGHGQEPVNAILWNSHFGTNPNVSPFAGDNVEVIQYSSTAPIAGLAAPGTGDMNSAIGKTAQGLRNMIAGAGAGGLSVAEVDDLMRAISVVRTKVEDTFNQVRISAGEVLNKANANTDTETNKIIVKLVGLEADLEAIIHRMDALEHPTVQVDTALLAEALTPLLSGIVESAVDKQLDERSFRTE